MDESTRHETDLHPLLAALSSDSHAQRSAALEALRQEGPRSAALDDLRERLARLDHLEREFDLAVEQAKLESLRELAYGASHEINNPLANISTRAQTLLRDEVDPQRRRMLATINSQAFRAHEMISDMMLFAKPPDLVREPIDLAQIVDQVIDEIATQASDQGTVVERRGCDQSGSILGDPEHLAAALTALCRNSLEAIEMGGRICISCAPAPETDGDAILLTVTDTGPGIPSEVREHLFDPFYSGREAGRGLGFGLSKCWRIINLHGGSIEVNSDAGAGARFTLKLPPYKPVPTPATLAHG